MAKKKEVDITCLFCRHYGLAKVIITPDSGTKKLCRKMGIEVRFNSPKCDLFELTPWFFCIKGDKRISLEICHKQFVKGYGCKSCVQGKIVEKLIAEKGQHDASR